MLTVNLWSTVGLCNGACGKIVDLIYDNDHCAPNLPIAVIVEFDDYSGPSFIESIPRSQGLTLSKVWIDLGKSEKVTGISYVAINRARNLDSCIIEPMSFEIDLNKE